MDTGNGSRGDIAAEQRPARTLRVGLSGKLLLLTILFVMVAEILIYVPSVANFRLNWLNDRLAAAHTAALVLDAAPSGMRTTITPTATSVLSTQRTNPRCLCCRRASSTLG